MGNAFSLHRRTLLLASLAAAALPSFPADAAVRRELRYATLGLDTSDPHRHTGSIAVQQCYAEPLTSIADDGQVKPFLAEKVTVSSDGRTYTLKIRQGVKFHNGDVLTAEDVVANINRIREKIKGGWLVSSLKNVENLSVPEPGTVVIAFARPFAPFSRALDSFAEIPGLGLHDYAADRHGPLPLRQMAPEGQSGRSGFCRLLAKGAPQARRRAF